MDDLAGGGRVVPSEASRDGGEDAESRREEGCEGSECEGMLPVYGAGATTKAGDVGGGGKAGSEDVRRRAWKDASPAHLLHTIEYRTGLIH